MNRARATVGAGAAAGLIAAAVLTLTEDPPQVIAQQATQPTPYGAELEWLANTPTAAELVGRDGDGLTYDEANTRWVATELSVEPPGPTATWQTSIQFGLDDGTTWRYTPGNCLAASGSTGNTLPCLPGNSTPAAKVPYVGTPEVSSITLMHTCDAQVDGWVDFELISAQGITGPIREYGLTVRLDFAVNGPDEPITGILAQELVDDGGWWGIRIEASSQGVSGCSRLNAIGRVLEEPAGAQVFYPIPFPDGP